jgi:hypothetical protein
LDLTPGYGGDKELNEQECRATQEKDSPIGLSAGIGVSNPIGAEAMRNWQWFWRIVTRWKNHSFGP